MPAGERQYLSRLICAGGARPTFERSGSVGQRNPFPKGLSDKEAAGAIDRSLRGAPLQAGEVDSHVIDAYEVSCGEVKRRRPALPCGRATKSN